MKSVGMCVQYHTSHIRIGHNTTIYNTKPERICSRGACKSKTINTPDCNFQRFFCRLRRLTLAYIYTNTYKKYTQKNRMYIFKIQYVIFVFVYTFIPFILKIHTNFLLSLVVVILLKGTHRKGTTI